MDVTAYNKIAWNKQVAENNQWTIPVSSELISKARNGEWTIVLTPLKPVPHTWFPPLNGAKVLALASGGGQQGPVLAAAGAQVTVFDNSPHQLAQDRFVAKRDGLSLDTIEGDMADLSCFSDASFDMIFHPCSNSFVPNVRKVWREASRVLKRGGVLLAGFTNPVLFAIDPDLDSKEGIVQIKYKIPYSDLTSLSEDERKRYTDVGDPLAFGHSLEDQLGGQVDAGLAIIGLYEDTWDVSISMIHNFMPCFIATRSVKL